MKLWKPQRHLTQPISYQRVRTHNEEEIECLRCLERSKIREHRKRLPETHIIPKEGAGGLKEPLHCGALMRKEALYLSAFKTCND
jgi:hypothetical protein